MQDYLVYKAIGAVVAAAIIAAVGLWRIRERSIKAFLEERRRRNTQ